MPGTLADLLAQATGQPQANAAEDYYLRQTPNLPPRPNDYYLDQEPYRPPALPPSPEEALRLLRR